MTWGPEEHAHDHYDLVLCQANPVACIAGLQNVGTRGEKN